MDNIISNSKFKNEVVEQEKYGKDNLNSYVHSGSSFMEFTKQRKNLGIDKIETTDSKNGIDYLQKKHNIFKNPENLINQTEKRKKEEDESGTRDIYSKNYMQEFSQNTNTSENDTIITPITPDTNIGILEDIYEARKKTNSWNDYGKTLNLSADGGNITINTTIENDNKNVEDIFNEFQKWIGRTKKWLMYVAIYRFSKSFDFIMNGSFKYDLFHKTFHENTIKILKDAMKEFVFNNTEILKLELSAKKIIETLLNDFIYAVRYWEEDNADEYMSKSDKKYINIIPRSLRDEYVTTKSENESKRLYNKFMMVIDFISGMTDSYAKNLYQELYGIK